MKRHQFAKLKAKSCVKVLIIKLKHLAKFQHNQLSGRGAKRLQENMYKVRLPKATL